MNKLEKLYYKLFNFTSDLVSGLRLFRVRSKIVFDTKDKKVISFSLFGNDERYLLNIDDCINGYKTIYPDWIIRVYVGKDVNSLVLDKLKNYGCELIIMNSKGIDFRYMFWRFLVFDDPGIKIAIVRDIDSMASVREKKMIDDWISSGKKLHIIRDHPNHQSRIMGGMWGLVINGKPYGIKKYILSFKKKWNSYGVDQEFLNAIYYKNAGDAYINDIYKRYNDETPVIIPHDSDYFYIGEINWQNGYNDELRNEIKKLYTVPTNSQE